jgi:hypothetical protein
MAALPSPMPTRLFALDSNGITIKEVAAITIPGRLLAGASLLTSEANESYAMYAESIRKHDPTIRKVSRSAASRRKVFLSW